MLRLRNFIQALEGQREIMAYNQFWRYTKAGKLPKVVLWIASNPDLAQALAQDAVELAQEKTTKREAA